MSESITFSRALVSEQNIRQWFKNIASFLKEKKLENIDSRRVFNANETALLLNPKSGTVLAEKGTKNVYNIIGNNDKENVTVLVTANAAGELAPITIPPPEERANIIRENHVSVATGHKGVNKTFYRIRQLYYQWPKMKTDIQAYIAKCKNCQLKKLTRRKIKQPMILTDTSDAAFDKISMDIMGPLPTSHEGNSYILTIQDLLTKYLLAMPLKHAGVIDVADVFINEFICTYGAPKTLLTD